MTKLSTPFFFLVIFALGAVGVFAQDTPDKHLKTGSYIATVTQSMFHFDAEIRSQVEIAIKIDSVDSAGNVKGEFIHSDLGRGGKGGISGRMYKDPDFKVYRMQLKGTFVSKFGDTWEVGVNATIGDKVLTRGDYGLNSKGGISMSGNFKNAELRE